MWAGLDLEFQLVLIDREEDQREILGVKIRAVNSADADDIRKVLSCLRIGFLECEDGFKIRSESYEKACKAIRQYLPIVPLPDHLQKLLKASEARYSTPRITDETLASHIPVELWNVAKPYQKEGLRYIFEHDGRAELADEMGVGKSFQAILFSFLYKKVHGPVLIICPPLLLEKWAQELRGWCRLVNKDFDSKEKPQITILWKGKDVTNLHVDKTQKDHYYLVAYSIIQNLEAVKALVAQQFKIIVADETHAVKNESAKRCISTQALCVTAKYVVLLSGTPGVRPLEWFTQFSMVSPFAFPESLKWKPPKAYGFASLTKDKTREKNAMMPYSYVSRWCDPFMETTFRHHKKWNHSGSARAEELHAVGREFVFIRRQAKTVLNTALPPKTTHYLTMDITKEDAEIVRSTMKRLNEAAAEHDDYERKKCWMEMFNDLPRMKKNFVVQHLRTTLLHNRMHDHKTIIFAHHIEMIDLIEQELQAVLVEYIPMTENKNKCNNKRKRMTLNHNEPIAKRQRVEEGPEQKEQKEKKKNQKTYIKIIGETPVEFRQARVSHFQNDDDCRVALLGLTAAGVGLDLFEASLVIMTEMYYTPGALAQAEARAHRLGCKKPVTVEYLVANGTLDQALLNIVSRKTEITSRVLDGVGSNTDNNNQNEETESNEIKEASVKELSALLL